MPDEAVQLEEPLDEGPAMRAAIALSLARQRPFRARLARPLSPHAHAWFRAAQAVSGATLTNDDQTVTLSPGPLVGGDYLLDAAGGPLPLLLECLLPPLLAASGPSRLKLRGVTHPADAPGWHALLLGWQPAMAAAGHALTLSLRSGGFTPEAPGEVNVGITPTGAARALDRRVRGTLREARVLTVLSRLPLTTAEQLGARALERLRERGIVAEAETLPVPSRGAGAARCLIQAVFERGQVALEGRAAPDAPLEALADAACDAFFGFLERRGGVDPQTAAMLLVPLALAADGRYGAERRVSRLSTTEITPAIAAQARVAARFLEVEVAVLAGEGEEGEVRVAPVDAGLQRALRRPEPAQ